MKIFVTGATGFIGSNFIDLAVNYGFDIVAQKRPGSLQKRKTGSRLIWVEKQLDGDFSSELVGCDALVHLAAHSMTPPYAPIHECIYWNVTAPMQIAEQAVNAGIKRFVFAGSCSEYGLSANDYDFIPPDAPLKPHNPYSVSKAAATLAACGLAREKLVELQVLRIFQAYGEGENDENRFWASMRKAALNGEDFRMSAGAQIRDFTPVSQICDVFLRAISDVCVPGKPVIRNVGTGVGMPLLDFAKEWWSNWGATGQLIPGSIGLRPGELHRIVADIDSVFEN